MANPELGAKQICPTCQAKFYDLGRRPAVCPKCATAFDPEEVVRSRRARPRNAVYDEPAEGQVKEAETEDAEDEEEADATPELDEGVEEDIVETDDDGEVTPAAPAEPDLGVGIADDDTEDEDDDDAADVPFLEDEDEDEFGDDEIDGLTKKDDDE